MSPVVSFLLKNRLLMKKYIYAVMAVAMALTSCSQDDNLPASTSLGDKVYNTTTFAATRQTSGKTFDSASGKKSVKHRTITNVQDWTLAWNDGTTKLFGNATKTGLNVDIDRVAFLATTGAGDWNFLQNDLNRQVFIWNRWSDAHVGHSNLSDGRCCAEFTVDVRHGETGSYEGLEPNTAYYGYYFMPYFKDMRLPLAGAPQAYVESLTQMGFNTRCINIGDWHLSDQDPSTIQCFLAENDFLEAFVCGTNRSTIVPSRDGVYNEQLNCYEDIAIDMRHAMALVEVELEFAEPVSEVSKELSLNVIKLVAQDANNNETKAFDVYAGLDSNGAWDYPTTDGSASAPVKPGILVSTTRDESTSTYQYMKDMGYSTLKYYMLVRQPSPADHYQLQVFSGTDFKPIDFYPGAGFMFQPGKVYNFKLHCDLKGAETGYDWMTSGEIIPLAPYNGKGSFWQK